jgi:hypothetical protein
MKPLEKAKIQNVKSNASPDCKISAKIHHMDFSIKMKHSMKSDWITASESLLE